jgi:hypothetical protein
VIFAKNYRFIENNRIIDIFDKDNSDDNNNEKNKNDNKIKDRDDFNDLKLNEDEKNNKFLNKRNSNIKSGI